MIRPTLFLAGATLAAIAPLAAQNTLTAQIDPQRLAQHVQTLGSDAFEGRGPATNGETKTVAYLSDQFAKAGLQPGGDLVNGQRTWTQAVPLLRSEFTANPQVTLNLAGKATPLTQGNEIAVRAPTNGDKAMMIDGVPLVFAGYGITAKDDAKKLDYDDYAGKQFVHAAQPPARCAKTPHMRQEIC